jgi:signal peptidase II
MRSAIPWITALLIVVADRITKIMLMERLEPGGWIEVMPGLALTHVHNPGIAFSLFADGGPLTRVVLHLVIFTSVVIIAAMLVRHAHNSRLAGIAFGLILGGALGNLIDRILYGWVVDFIHVWARMGDRTLSWPDFNVADAAISCGAVLLIIGELVNSHKREDDAPDPA